VYLLTADAPAALELDELLWTFSQGSFVPHAVYKNPADAESNPVLIGHNEPPAEYHDVLVSLAPEVPPWFSRFARVAELVAPDEAEKARARERFRFYRERGYPLESHNL
jgi:DNA polymerase-3 subunit chi